MAESVTIRLYDTQGGAARVAIELGGTRAGPSTDVTVASATVTTPAGATTYQAAGAVKPLIPAAYIDQAQGAADLRLAAGPAPATIPIGLAFSTSGTTTVPFLDRGFLVGDGAELTLVLSLPGPAAGVAAPPWVVLTGRGAVAVAPGSATFASVAIGFRIVIDGPPAIPSAPLAAIELELPGEIPWPPLRIPWPDFPKLPPFPIRLPGLSVGLDALPVRLGFKAVGLSVDAGGIVTLHVEQLQIDGVGGGLGGSFDLVFQGGNVAVMNASFPALNGFTPPAFKSLSPGCFGFDWTGSPVDPLLRLVTTECDDVSNSTDNAMQLRVHAPGLQVDEVRLDWSASFADRTFNLPGFRVKVPAPRMFSLVAARPSGEADDGGSSRLTLAATFDAGKVLSAESTFSWPLTDGDREMHRDGDGTNSDSLISVSARSINPVSVVLFDLPLGSGGPPRFLQQLEAPLGSLADLESGAGADDGSDFIKGLFDPCPTSPIDLEPLSAGDWALDLKVNLPPAPNDFFTLPFLKLGDDQYLRITRIDPVSCSMGADLQAETSAVAPKFRLTVGGAAHPIDLGGSPTLASLAAAIANLGLGVVADLVRSPSGVRLVLIPPVPATAVKLEALEGARATDFCPAMGFSCSITLKVGIGPSLTIGATAGVIFDPARMAFLVDHSRGVWLSLPGPVPKPGDPPLTFLGLTWAFTPNPEDRAQPDGSVVPKNALFNLATKGGDYQVRQAPGSVITVSYDRATMPGEPIVFKLTDLGITPKGLDLTATITDQPARFNGLETQFRFKPGELQVRENRVKGFTISGNGPLPPALIDNASADVFLQFGQASDGGPVRLERGSAQIKGSNLLSCHLTRFDFSLDGIGLEFVDDGGADHLFFTLSGKAKYAPIPGDDTSGPLSWLPKVEIQLVDCPLTGNMKVIAKHVKFLVELPKKLTFSLLGCFEMEIRAIGFLPQFDQLKATSDPKDGESTSAMQVSGQIYFAEQGGDVIETKIDFHDLFVALPARGQDLPRIHCKGLSLSIKQGDAFELSGEVDFFDDEPVDKNPDGSPIFGDGFAGGGVVQIQGLPKLTATFAFLRVSVDGRTNWKRAWFLYIEADEMSIQIPVVEIFIREIGLGFGYRYTLASIKTADQITDPRKLLQELKRLAKTQGNLSSRDQWRVDLEEPGEGPRWTVALRAMISETSAQAGPFGDYLDTVDEERDLACLFLFDVVLALRSDLTFFMAGRAWVNTNYPDFNDSRTNNTTLKDNPLFAAFILLSPRQKRFLANLSSNQGAEFGGHPPLPVFIEDAIRDSKFTATLLVEPDLFHLELGWPDQLQWQAKLGPLQAEFRGGAIFRVSTTELVVGNSFLARGTLDLTAGFDAGLIGASLSAFAQVAYGARYIGVLNFTDVGLSAFYGAIGVEIRVTVSIDFWIKIPLLIKTIKLSFHFSFGISFTAALEVGIILKPDAGARGIATIGLQLMGHSVQFDVRVGLNDSVVDTALDRTNRFLHIGLEAENVDPVPGTDAALAAHGAHIALSHQVALASRAAKLRREQATFAANASRVSTRALALAAGISPPTGYTLVAVDAPNASGAGTTVYYLLVPKAADPGQHQGFFPPPPDDATLGDAAYQDDLRWTFPAPGASVKLQHLDPLAAASAGLQDIPTNAPIAWKVDWKHEFPFEGTGPDGNPSVTIRDFLIHAYLTELFDQDRQIRPVSDPDDFAPLDQPVTDPRVQDPSEDAYESAVRGALAEVAAPFFKFDEQSPYDSTLKAAFAKDTTIYHATGSTAVLTDQEKQEVEDARRAIQLRGSILHAMLRDVQQYAALDGTPGSDAAMATLRAESTAFRLGVVFRASGDDAQVRWLESGGGTVEQRKSVISKAVDSGPIAAAQFNPKDSGFVATPPAFLRVRKYEHANMVAIAWDLRRGGGDAPTDPEDHLSHYQVRRLHLNGKDPEAVFLVKEGAVLHRAAGVGMTIQPRFQMIDRFDAEVGSDVSALTEEGKLYLYTITPVDLSGGASPRPLSIVAARLPADPPLVPGDGELVLKYHLSDVPSDWENLGPTKPSARVPDAIEFQWSDPPPAPGTSPPAVESYRLVFRRENALPIGFFGADADTRGGRTAGFPVTNARTLRTDRVVVIERDDQTRDRGPIFDPETGLKLRADSGRVVQRVTVTAQELQDLDVLPADGPWRPDAWRVFVQAVSPRRGPAGSQVEGVPSALAAVTVRLHFETRFVAPAGAVAPPAPPAKRGKFVITPFEERKVGLLEWLPDPIRFELLPPEDQTSRSGFAQVPMPILDDAQSSDWHYALAAPIAADGTLRGLRFEAHPERFRALKMTWNQGPGGAIDRPIELHAKYQLFEFDADARTAESLDIPAGKPVDVGDWARGANLRLAQEVELLPPDDLALVPADASNPVAWDVWTPATSRRILLRREMIADRTWPGRSDPTRLGPWFSWRDSYLDWPPAGAPPAFDKGNRRLWPFHELFRAVLSGLLSLPEGPPPPGSPWPLALYSVEVSRGATRANSPGAGSSAPSGGGKPVNDFPDPNNPDKKNPPDPTRPKPSTLAAFLAANSPESDPHGWGVLDRMGLAVSFRVRERKTGRYVIGRELAELVRRMLFSLNATAVSVTAKDPKTLKPGGTITLNINAQDDAVSYLLLDGTGDPTSPVAVPKGTTATIKSVLPPPGSPLLLFWGNATVADPTNAVTPALSPPKFDEALKYLFVESLFQPGARTEIGPDDLSSGQPAPAGGLLALVRLSLRPKLKQRMRYQSFEITGLAPGTTTPLILTPGSPLKVTITTANAEASYMIQTGTPGIPNPVPPGSTTIEPIMPKEGRLVLSLRGAFDASATIATVTASDLAGKPLTVSTPRAFAPTDWQSAYFAVSPAAPWAKSGGPEQVGWDALQAHLKKVRADLVLPDQTTPNDLSAMLSWLDRFFEEGGDVALNGGTTATATGDGPWVASAYPRAATPIALTPDRAGRITYYQPIEDLWGHTFRYFLRPQGRYDLLWASLSRSARVFDAARGVIAAQQALIDAPEPGGMDVALERIRPLAAPLVLSSRRLDQPGPPGQAVSPGATWEVIVAKHPEQALVEKNRALVNHLGFRQVAHALVRSSADPQAIADLRATLASVVSGVFPSETAAVPKSYKLTVGAVTQPFDLAAPTLDQLVAKINGLGLPVVASVTPRPAAPTLPAFRLVLKPTSATSSLGLAAVDGMVETGLMSEPLDLSDGRFELPVNSRPTADPRQIPPPPLPGPPAQLDHLDLSKLGGDDALSLDLPLRSTDFGQGVMALQWRSLPFYYKYKLLLIAQSSAVVSPITGLDQRDFQYISPAPSATMQGVPTADGTGRRRKITVRLGRYWDCLPADAQRRWPIEDPASVGNTDPTSPMRRLSSLPDPDVIYQVVVTHPSRNVEVVAEYRHDASQVSGYASRPLPGPFQGDAVRSLPPEDGPGVGSRFVFLETLLTRVAAPGVDDADVVEPISGRAAFAGAKAAGVTVAFPPDSITACALRLDGDLSPAMLADLVALADGSDASFAGPLRKLLAQLGPGRYAEACVGLEQLAEIHDGVTINPGARTITWPGPISPGEEKTLTTWIGTSLFSGTLTNLRDYRESFAYPADAANPVQADTTLAADRLKVEPTGLTWFHRLTAPATAPEIAALDTLKGKAGLPAPVVSAIAALIADVSAHATVTAVVPIAEPFWKPRPTQGTLPASLQGRLLVGNGVIGFRGLMTLQEGKALQGLAGLSAPDQAAVARLFAASLEGGLGGGTLEVRARRGGADSASAVIAGDLSQAET